MMNGKIRVIFISMLLILAGCTQTAPVSDGYFLPLPDVYLKYHRMVIYYGEQSQGKVTYRRLDENPDTNRILPLMKGWRRIQDSASFGLTPTAGSYEIAFINDTTDQVVKMRITENQNEEGEWIYDVWGPGGLIGVYASPFHVKEVLDRQYER